MKKIILFSALIFIVLRLNAGEEITYYLPSIEYDENIPSPESFLGYKVGEWHIHHAQLVHYMQLIAEKSGRAEVYEYARSYQQRPLVNLIITSEENHRNLEAIRENHLKLADPESAHDLDVENMPLIVRLGYGVHGNEPSSHNASKLVAYYLAAGMCPDIEQYLDDMVIIIDPSLNPDGQDRFASWVNRHKSMTPNSDPADREFSDVWPGSRTNHYWFDLNRDWLPVQHPEGKGRVEEYQRWLPNISTDHHEFGSQNTFFFSPGIPGRENPRTPERTVELTMELAGFHAEAFDEIGEMYMTREMFDDFYYGYGSTYPDAHGGLGILFEQASSRGHVRETVHGDLTFASTIRNQVLTSLSTLEGGLEMRDKLLDHMRWFFTSAVEEARQEDFNAYIFGDRYDQGRNYHFKEILKTHDIEFYGINESVEVGGDEYSPGKAWVVPLEQPQYRYIQSLFEKRLEFEDSLFYDASTWSMPLAFNLPHGKITSQRQLSAIKGEQVEENLFPEGELVGEKTNTAYLFEWDEFYAPKALYFLQKHGIRAKVATEPLSINNTENELVDFNYGTISVPVQTQELCEDEIYELVREAAEMSGVTVHSVGTSLAREGIHIGSGSFAPLEKPEVLLVTGPGTSSGEAGQVWHHLDQRYRMPVTKIEQDDFNNTDLERYNTIIMVSGNYRDVEPELLERWVRRGGKIVAIGTSSRWLEQNGLADIEFVSAPSIEEPERLPYKIRSEHRGARRIPGSIFEAELDITHPIGYGYRNEKLPLYVSGTFAAKPDKNNPFVNPLIFTDDALMSGYVWDPYLDIVNNSAAVLINSRGRGNVISLIHNPNFRAYWFGNSKLFANSIFFGGMMRR